MELSPSPMMGEETVAKLKELLKKGALGAGVFKTSDCRKTYAELKERGVEFTSEPTERPAVVEALMKDNSGNWFSLTEPRG